MPGNDLEVQRKPIFESNEEQHNSDYTSRNKKKADQMQIIYQIINRSGYQVSFSDQMGVLPFEKTLRGYVDF